ncbi:MAG: PilZ domain-containing protein [Proteobacteria bacterium]|nr:PilZ domain-containing protein [Pseudomonadota bacterium]
MGIIEQRRTARFDIEVAAEVYTPNEVLPANTRNLSNTGVCLDITKAIREGSVVGVSLFFTSDGIEDPDMEPLNLKANVIWCTERDDSGYSVGAHFDEMTSEHIAMLAEFLSALGE